jgi:protein subunit release factor B
MLQRTMTEPPYDIPEDDAALLDQCDVQVFHASGPGGQSVNTSDSAVRLKHRPSGVTVTCRRERSQLLNKRACLRRLRERLEKLNAPPPEPRRPTRKSRGVRASELADKARRGRLKQLRKPPTTSD